MKTRRATVSLKTVGCRLNQAETAVIRASFEEAGFKTVRFGEPCDLCVIHGCVVTSQAEEDSLRLARSIKRRYPDVFVILAGCIAELLNNEGTAFDGRANRAAADEPSIIRRLGQRPCPTFLKIPIHQHTDADFLAGQKEKFNLPEIIGRHFQSSARQGTKPLPSFLTQRAIVKIQDGCDCNCAYCIVPRVRGAARSRPSAEIIEEISKLTLCGFPEVVLTGANIGCYAEGAGRLPQLLEKIEAIPGLRRLRISSLEIATVAREVIDFLASSKKMCSFLHLPLQSGSNRILKAMGRPYTVDEFSDVVQYAQKKTGQIGLGTDIIVGFPGENADDFEATMDVVRNLPFSKLHVFNYSPRPGTPASSMPGQVPAKDREMRSVRLIELGRQKRNQFTRSLVEKKVSVLVEKVTPDGWAEGWTGEYIRARIHGPGLKPKQIVEFAGKSAKDDILLGPDLLFLPPS